MKNTVYVVRQIEASTGKDQTFIEDEYTIFSFSCLIDFSF